VKARHRKSFEQRLGLGLVISNISFTHPFASGDFHDGEPEPIFHGMYHAAKLLVSPNTNKSS